MDPNEQQNSYNQNNQGQTPVPPSYVYPQPGNSWQPIPPAKQPRKHTAGRLLGFAAIFLAVALILATVGGGLMFSYLKALPPTNVTTDQSSTSETTASTGTQIDNNNKHWSVSGAATLPDGAKKALSVMEIAALGKPAVVAINTTGTMTDLFGQTGNFEAAGSGFVITADGYIVTNNHVIAEAKVITVVMDNGEIYDAKLIGTDPRSDLAVIKVAATNLPIVYLGDSDKLQVGELAVAIGNPLGELSGSVTAGIISALDRQIALESQTLNLLQTDAAINPGNSGGALFNSFGEVIGINTAKTSQTGIEGLGFAIPINDAGPVIESIINFGYVKGRPKIGISTRDISKQMAEFNNLTEGIYINSVEPGSAADVAGLQTADIIIAANGQKTLTVAELAALKDKLNPGDKLVLTIVREGKQTSVTLILQEDNPAKATAATTA
jgi:serine protease Do